MTAPIYSLSCAVHSSSFPVMSLRGRFTATLFCCLLTAAEQVYGAGHSQPPQTSFLNGFEVVGNSYASAQQVYTCPAHVVDLFTFSKVFLGTTDKVYIVDKVENNAQQIKGHPVWAAGGWLHPVRPSWLHSASLQNGPRARSRPGRWTRSPTRFAPWVLCDVLISLPG